MPAINLQDLPVELKLQILSNLPAKEIQRVRQTSKHLRDLIDLEENQSALTQPATSKALQAVQNLHTAIFNFDPVKTDLLSLLSKFYRIRGKPNTDHELVLRLFLRRHAPQTWDQQHFDCLHFLLQDLCALHVYHHKKEELLSSPPYANMDRFKTKAVWLAFTAGVYPNFNLKVDIPQDTFAEFYDRIVDGHELASAEVDTSPVEIYNSTLGGISQHLALGGNENPMNLFRGRETDDQRLYEILGVPELPTVPVSDSTFSSHTTGTLYYGVKSRWAYSRVMQLLGDPQAGVDRKITAMELAAVRQEVFLW